MSVISTSKDVNALTLTLVADLDAKVERVWELWEDPRELERWWGPPGWPATFDDHEFVEGGRSSYYMTGPAGEESRGWWQIVTLDPPHRIELDDGFADDQGRPLDTMEAMRIVATLEPLDGRTRMTVVTTFASADQLAKVLDMGMEEGLRQAVDQIDELLA
jgi:uncharacterized protein YndB with AHSA1/START domain